MIFVSNRQRKLRIRASEVRLAAAAAAEHAKIGGWSLSVVIIGDRKMRQLNRDYAGVAGTTDVLAFDLSGEAPADAEAVDGEVIVNASEALLQAARRSGDARDELLLYVVHGVLHLGGYRDADRAQKKRMRAAEAAVRRGLRRSAKRD